MILLLITIEVHTVNLWCGQLTQGVSFSQKFWGKCDNLNLVNGRTSQFMFPKNLEYENVKRVKTKFKSEKSNKNKHKNNVVLKENKKKYIKIDMMSVSGPLSTCLLI